MTASLARVPCTVVTGFLGAGKTTLIRHVLENAGGRRLAIIVNEFGDVGIDGEILKGCGVESCPEENIVELANGCICCTVADDFVPALDQILSRTPRVDHILIETSGLALPKPLVQAFQWPAVQEPRDGRRRRRGGRRRRRWPRAGSPPTWRRWRRSAAADPSLDHDDPVEEVFEDQVACADLVILTKSDLLDAAGAGARQRHRRRASAARRQDRAERARPGRSGGAARPRPRGRGRRSTSRKTHHDDELDHDHDDFDSFVVELPSIGRAGGAGARGSPAAAEAENVLRVKGFVEVAGKPMRLLVQGVGPRVNHHYDRAWRAERGPPHAAGGDRPEGPRPRRRRDASWPADHAPPHHHHPRRWTTWPSRSISARRRPRSWRCPSPTATSPALAAAWQAEAGTLPAMRLAALRDLRHPMSVDLWVDRVARACAGHPGAPPRRLRLVALWLRPARRVARERGIALALLPGECRERDARLIGAVDLARATELEALLGYFREGGPANMRALVRRLAGLAGARSRRRRAPAAAEGRASTSRATAASVGRIAAMRRHGRPRRADPLLSLDAAGRRRRADRRAGRGAGGAGASRPVPIFVPSLKDPAVARLRRGGAAATGAGGDRHRDGLRQRRGAGGETLFDGRRAGLPGHRRRRRGARPGRTASAGWRRPTSPCMSCCPNSTAASSPARSRSRPSARPDDRARPSALRQPARAGPRRAGGARASRRMLRLQQTPRAERRIADPDPGLSGGAAAAPAMRSASTCRRACSPCCTT